MNYRQNSEHQLNDAATQELQTAVEKLAELELIDEEAVIALTNLYLKSGQNTKAIETLEKVVSAGQQTAAIYRILGDIFVLDCTQNYAKAKQAYEKAIELALDVRDLRDLETLIAAKGGLTPIEEQLGNKDKAQRLREEARALCETSCNALAGLGVGNKLMTRLRLLSERRCGECNNNGPGRWVGRECRQCNCPNS
jgi:tetratricopeptide (TPR) repeat protein